MSANLLLALAPLALDLRAPLLSGVYFIQRGDDGPIKIGWSNNVRTRLASLQTAHHERLHLRAVLAGQQRDERRLHAWFADERIGGEWFRTGGEVMAFVVALTHDFTARQEAHLAGHVSGWKDGFDSALDWAEENWLRPKVDSSPLVAPYYYSDRCKSLLAQATEVEQDRALTGAIGPEDERLVTVYAGDLYQLLIDSRNEQTCNCDEGGAYQLGYSEGRAAEKEDGAA